jgi:hypothetical protein
VIFSLSLYLFVVSDNKLLPNLSKTILFNLSTYELVTDDKSVKFPEFNLLIICCTILSISFSISFNTFLVK